MIPKTKLYLFVALFLVISLSYLVWLFLFPSNSLAQVANLFEVVWLNMILLVISFLFIALCITELIDFFYNYFLEWRWQRFKLGEILISEGYITNAQLKEALAEQKLRIGEVLIESGRLTADQLKQALDYQRKFSNKLGEILKYLGYATEEDIAWALERMDRKLGKILREKKLITDDELDRVMALRRYKSHNPGWIGSPL